MKNLQEAYEEGHVLIVWGDENNPQQAGTITEIWEGEWVSKKLKDIKVAGKKRKALASLQEKGLKNLGQLYLWIPGTPELTPQEVSTARRLFKEVGVIWPRTSMAHLLIPARPSQNLSCVVRRACMVQSSIRTTNKGRARRRRRRGLRR